VTPQTKWSRVMTPTTNREHNNRELTDAELLGVSGGTDTGSRVKRPTGLGSEPTPID
jgi:hypothetical protein